MKKRHTKKEARSWTDLEKCLQAPILYRTVKGKKGGLCSILPDDITTANLRHILSGINEKALEKGRYDVMDIFYQLFFSETAAKSAEGAADYALRHLDILKRIIEHPLEREREGKTNINIKKRTLKNPLSVLNSLDALPSPYHGFNKKLEDIQKRLDVELDEYFNAALDVISLSPETFKQLQEAKEEIKLAMQKVRESTKDWLEKERFVEADRVLRDIKDPHPYKTLARLVRAIPKTKSPSREAIKVNVKRYKKKQNA